MTEKKPSIYIPTLYFAEGLPYTIVMQMSNVLFKNLGASNELVGLTSWLYLPWVIKLFWGPVVDLLSTKRAWIVTCEFVLAGLTALIAAAVVCPQAIPMVIVLMEIMAFVSATQDIAIDGFYLDALSPSKQAFFVGIRGAAYKVATLVGSGALVFLAGKLGEFYGIASGWSMSFACAIVLFLLLGTFHYRYLPKPKQVSQSGISFPDFANVFKSYFQQSKIVPIVLYIFIFRLGDALMLKMAQPFMLDPIDKGGLGISTADVGIVYGTVGMLFLLAGGIFGGWLVSRDGLRKWLWPTAIIQNSAILLYWYLSLAKPNLIMVTAVNAFEQFSYGLGVAAYTVFLLNTVNPKYKTAHYAITTGFMALGMMLPGAISGYLVTWLGYSNFFLLSFCAAIPGIITIFFLPTDKIQSVASSKETQEGSSPGGTNGIQEAREVGPSRQ